MLMVPPEKNQRYDGYHLVEEWLAKNKPTKIKSDSEYIKAVRAKCAKITAEEMAKLTGRSVPYCTRIKMGQEPMSLKIADELNKKLKLGVKR